MISAAGPLEETGVTEEGNVALVFICATEGHGRKFARRVFLTFAHKNTTWALLPKEHAAHPEPRENLPSEEAGGALNSLFH